MRTFQLPTTSARRSPLLATRISAFPLAGVILVSLQGSEYLLGIPYLSCVTMTGANRWMRVTLLVQLNNPPNLANGYVAL